jgi:hypothetical protein
MGESGVINSWWGSGGGPSEESAEKVKVVPHNPVYNAARVLTNLVRRGVAFYTDPVKDGVKQWAALTASLDNRRQIKKVERKK